MSEAWIMEDSPTEGNPNGWKRFKSHVERNKKVYIVSGVSVVLGIVGGYLLPKSVEGRGDVYEGPVIDLDSLEIEDSEVNILSPQTHIYNTTNNYGGYQSKIVKNLDTGEVFESQKAAAESVGVSEQAMSRHLSGCSDDIHGNVFDRIGMGTV